MTDMRVLAAEDSPTQAAVLRSHLEAAGFAVALAGDGAQALQLMRQEPFDLVVSDVVMPGVDGYELCRQVKEMHPNVPVVLLTSMADPLDVVNALSAGADNFMRKPYEPTELIHRIRNMLHNKQLREAGRAQMGLELFFLGRRFMINSDREQILDLLVSTFEDLVSVNQRLSAREEELAEARDALRDQLTDVKAQRDRLDAVLGALPSGMGVFRTDGTVVHANEKLAELVGISRSTLQGAVVWDTVHFVDNAGNPVPREQRPLSTTLTEGREAASGLAFDLFIRREDGTRLPVVARTQAVRDQDKNLMGAVGTLEDLRMLMDHDAVTGLPGHGILVDRLASATELGAERGAETAVVVAVIDRYDRLRVSLPASGSENVVATVASRLRAALDSSEVAQRAPAASAAHLGEGEFAVVLPVIDDATDAVVVAQLLIECMSGAVADGDLEVAVTASAAVGLCHDEPDVPTLVGSVATAARGASRDGGARVAASDGRTHEHVLDVLRREGELRSALERGELVVHYQPQLTVRDERPVGVEALVRWQHPDRGLLGAGEVVPVAVESGLIGRVGWYVLESACTAAARWHRDLPGAVRPVLSVNLAAEQLADPDAPGRIEDILRRTGFHPSDLVLEITEGSMMENAVVARDRLAKIKTLGCRIAIDDFGTGYSSLRQLRTLPVDVLKIDHSFVSGMLAEPADAAIVAGVIRLGRALGLEVVAEGIEDVDQLVRLRVLGCDLGQGFNWARAMPAEQVPAWWAAQSSAAGIAEASGGAMLETDDREDEVISYLVHELRSPLTAISGFAQLLQLSPREASEDEYVDAIVRNADELDARLSSLREVNSVLRGGLTLQSTDCDVVELVRLLVHDMAPQLEPHLVTFASNGSANASVDPARLVQAIGNLLTNAAKFSPGDTPIEVGVHGDGGVLRIDVRDHGPGVPAERRPELFRRFSRLGSSASGMGLGLYLARLVVEAHGGLLRYDDAPGGGALFSVRLPRRTTTPVASATDASTSATGVLSPRAARATGLKILCVEDDASTAALIQRVLDQHEVRVAADGHGALGAADDFRPDLVLLDRHLGDIDGQEVLRRLRSHPATGQLPLMILTGCTEERTATELVAAGADAVLGKPFRPEDLRAAVDSVVRGDRVATGDAVQPVSADPGAPLDLDLVAAVEQLAGDREDLHDLVASAIGDARQHVLRIRDALAADDRQRMIHLAHSLAGGLGNFGAQVVRARCRELEGAACASDGSAIRSAVEAVAEAVGHAERALLARFPRDDR